MSVVLVAAGVFLAWANGANDVSKGIATLVAGGVTGYRRAILWGTAWALAGSLAAAFFATAMVATFGSAFVVVGVTPTAATGLAVVVGAAAWVVIATRTGMPVSTTHAIVGSLAGVTTAAFGSSAVAWSHVATKIVLPLLVSPAAGFVATWLALRVARRAAPAADCICAVVHAPVTTAGAVASIALEVTTAPAEECATNRGGLQLRLDHAHWLTSGATSFARALNDTPKIVALVVAGGAVGERALFLGVALAMAAGSLMGGLRVSRVLAEEVTTLDHREGFVANAVTSVLVALGAGFGLPMSTTHVSSTAIVGAGVARGASFDARTLRHVALAWVVTLPASALLGAAAYGIAR
ncbi:MAG TPA: inorganic phosphate transporter [Labilithrix sp.]